MQGLDAIVLLLVAVIILAFLELVWDGGAFILRLLSPPQVGPLPDMSVLDLMIWSVDVDSSMDQLRAAYEWHIDQWVDLGRIILTAALGFVSALAVGWLKNEIKLDHAIVVTVVAVGLTGSFLVFAYCQRTVQRLRHEFMAIYTILRII